MIIYLGFRDKLNNSGGVQLFRLGHRISIHFGQGLRALNVTRLLMYGEMSIAPKALDTEIGVKAAPDSYLGIPAFLMLIYIIPLSGRWHPRFYSTPN